MTGVGLTLWGNIPQIDMNSRNKASSSPGLDDSVGVAKYEQR